MSAMTRQDLLSVTELAKNKIIERLVTKYDVQAACDSVRDNVQSSIQSMHMENQAMIRQLNAQKDQSWRKITSLEAQVSSLQEEIRSMRQMLGRLVENMDDNLGVNQTSGWDLSLPVK